MFAINNRRETPEEKRERLRQEELKKNSTGALKDGFDRGENGNLSRLSWWFGLERNRNTNYCFNSWICFV